MNTRIGVRIPVQLRERMDDAVNSGRFEDISSLIREAVERFLEGGGV